MDAGLTYRFRVRSINIHGHSEPSEPSEAFSFGQQDDTSGNDFEPRFVAIESGDVFKARSVFFKCFNHLIDEIGISNA